MALMRTSNPALNAKSFADVRRDPSAPAMSLEGTVNKAAFLLFLVAVPAAWVWSQVRTGFDPAVAGPWIALGVIGGLISAIVTIAKKAWSPGMAPVHPALDGRSLGGLPASLVVSGVIVIVAALNLILDFDFIETGVTAGAPKYMEWYGAFGLMVTLIWLYLEILRLLAKSRSRR